MKKLGPTQPRSGIRFKFGRRGKNPVAGEVNGTVKHVTPTKKKKSLALRQFDVVPISGSMMRSVVSPSDKVVRVPGDPSNNLSPTMTTSSLRIRGSIGYGKDYVKRRYSSKLIGSSRNRPLGALPYSSVVVDYAATGTYTSPSWTHKSIGFDQAFVQRVLSSSDHEAQNLNYYRSGSSPLETTAVPVSATLYYSKRATLQKIIVKHSASANDTVLTTVSGVTVPFNSGSGAWLPNTGVLCNYVSGVNVPLQQNYTNCPATILIPVPVSGKLVDINVWVELTHHSKSAAISPLASLGVSIKNPNVSWGHAHPIFNDPTFQNEANYNPGIATFYKDTFLLWEGSGHGPAFRDDNWTVYPLSGANVDSEVTQQKRYPTWDNDRSMRVVFSDGASILNPRHLYSATSPLGNYVGAPCVGALNVTTGFVSLGCNVPWTSDKNGQFAGDPTTYQANGSPPKGWLTGPGGTNDINEWPTSGTNYGAKYLRPVYPLLDDLVVKHSWNDPQIAVTIGTPTTLTPDRWTGRRPGLRGTEISGTWQLFLVSNYNGYFGDDQVPDLVFKQVRLEITYQSGPSAAPRRVKRQSRVRPTSNKTGLLYQYMISGSAPDFADGNSGLSKVYSVITDEALVGRNCGITLGSGSSEAALSWFITGALEAFSGSNPGWLVNNFFGMPAIPTSSASLVTSYVIPSTTVESPQKYVKPSRLLDGARKMVEVADDVAPPLRLSRLALQFATGSTS